MQDSVEALEARTADSCQPRIWDDSLHQELSTSHNSGDIKVDYSFHALQLSEDARRQGQEGSCSQSAELQNSEDSSLANRYKAENLKKPSALHGESVKIPQTCGDRLQKLGESCPLSSGNCLSNGREVSSLLFPAGNELQDDGELIAVPPPQVPSDNGLANVNGFCKPLAISAFEGRFRFKLAKATSKDEIKMIQKKLECELDQVRWLVKQLEAKELQLASYNSRIRDSNLRYNSNYIGNVCGDSYSELQDARIDVVDRRMLVRATTEMGVMGHQEIRPTELARANSDLGAARNIEMRPYSRQLSVAVTENNYVDGLLVEKEKRIPKVNRYYRNSEFLLGKDRLPPESNKRLKNNNGRKQSGEIEHAFHKSRNQVFKSCSNLLQRLMKHNHGWVFNEPVNAKAMGLVDYHDIIKHPMDLGTIKTRLSQNWYKCPREFAEDVRLVFGNAMTYNPKGQDVHVMAELLSQIFEEGWACIGTAYSHLWKYHMYQDAGLPTPNFRKAPPLSHFALASTAISGPSPITDLVSDPHPIQVTARIPSSAPISWYAAVASSQMRTSDGPETMTTAVAADPRVPLPHSGRPPVLKKPKAKDPDKRDMTYDEKQRLSTNLESLSAEKLDAIYQIIKKRNTALTQHDDEIEVDIDNVDAETLWELDRFVANYKKGLSKNKRKAEIALGARSIAYQIVAPTNMATAEADVRVECETALEKSTTPPVVEGEKQGYTGRSSSSSSSSNDSSSSSDSDSDSSSENGSDAGHSPGT